MSDALAIRNRLTKFFSLSGGSRALFISGPNGFQRTAVVGGIDTFCPTDKYPQRLSLLNVKYSFGVKFIAGEELELYEDKRISRMLKHLELEPSAP